MYYINVTRCLLGYNYNISSIASFRERDYEWEYLRGSKLFNIDQYLILVRFFYFFVWIKRKNNCPKIYVCLIHIICGKIPSCYDQARWFLPQDQSRVLVHKINYAIIDWPSYNKSPLWDIDVVSDNFVRFFY